MRGSICWSALLAALALATPSAQSTEGHRPEDLFLEGNAHYENGRYSAAAASYRGVLRYQIRDPVLEYNLANAEFRLGNLGQAILHYERAHRLDPTDRDTLANLQFARSFRLDQIAHERRSGAVGWIQGLQNRLGPDRQAWGVLGVVWLIGAIVTWCSSRPGGWSATHGWALGALLGLLLLLSGSWYTTLHRLDGRRSAVVLDPVVEVLAGPGRNNPALFTVHEGLSLWIRGERDEWLQVSLPNGLNGWIAKEAVGEV